MSDYLGSWWRKPPVADPPTRVWRDWPLVAVIVVASLVEGVARPEIPWRELSVAVSIALAFTLPWRRTHPLAVATVAFTTVMSLDIAEAVNGVESPGLVTMVYLLMLPYSLWRWASGRHAIVGTLLVVVTAGLATVLDYTGLADLIGGYAVLFAAAESGAVVRGQAESRDQAVSQAKSQERERLARDLHDSVAHHISAIAVRAQAGQAVSATDPDAANDALRVIEAEARTTLAEMRSLVGELRNGDPALYAPTPGLADITGLAVANGVVPVSVSISGDTDSVPETVGTATYRIVQESVTNAHRHARHASRVDVDVAVESGAVSITVADDGASSPRRADETGFGLAGMTERAALLGGTLEAGPRTEGGWTVRARLPFEP
jgi:signal transduction histidine kinase